MEAPGEWDWRRAREVCLRETARVLRDPFQAEDAAQEALLRAWRARASCSNPHAPAGWLAAIARNVAFSRRTAFRQQVPLAVADELVGADLLEPALRGLIVRDVLERLSEDDRTLLDLRYAEDLTQAEIARKLDCPPGTVAVRLHRLRRRLQAVLQEP